MQQMYNSIRPPRMQARGQQTLCILCLQLSMSSTLTAVLSGLSRCCCVPHNLACWVGIQSIVSSCFYATRLAPDQRCLAKPL